MGSRSWIKIGIVGAVLVLSLVFVTDHGVVPEVLVSHDVVRPGDYFVVSVEPIQVGDAVKVSAEFLKEAPKFYPDGEGGGLGIRALVPVEYRTEPGPYVVQVEIINENGRATAREEHALTINPREFPIQRMYVSPELHAIRDETLWEQDRVWTSRAKSDSNPQPLWEGSFLQPLTGRLTTGFGQIRYINDQESGRHSGLDIAAPSGTPILASNNGIITLARELNVTGNTVIIDHGYNLFTSYGHLEHIHVTSGQPVKKGEQIGTVGNTGFSTGPHLHWSVVIGSVFIDPELVLQADPVTH